MFASPCSTNDAWISGKSFSIWMVDVPPVSSRNQSSVICFLISALCNISDSNSQKGSCGFLSLSVTSARVTIHLKASWLVRVQNLWISKYGNTNHTAQNTINHTHCLASWHCSAALSAIDQSCWVACSSSMTSLASSHRLFAYDHQPCQWLYVSFFVARLVLVLTPTCYVVLRMIRFTTEWGLSNVLGLPFSRFLSKGASMEAKCETKQLWRWHE